jgi:hypothetical protein
MEVKEKHPIQHNFRRLYKWLKILIPQLEEEKVTT